MKNIKIYLRYSLIVPLAPVLLIAFLFDTFRPKNVKKVKEKITRYYMKKKSDKIRVEFIKKYASLFNEFTIKFEARTAGAFCFYGRTIVLNELVFSVFDEDECLFALLHECGHVAQGHTNNPCDVTTKQSHEQEFTADMYAIKSEYGEIAKKGAEKFFARFKNWDEESYTHPCHRERVNRIRQA